MAVQKKKVNQKKPAAKKQAPVRAKKRPAKKQGSGIVFLIFIVLALISAVKWQAGSLIALFLLPTIVLALTATDNNQTKKVFCVGFMNLAGVTPYAIQVWEYPNRFLPIIQDAVNIIVMFGAAGAGYALLWICPIIMSVVLQAFSQDRLKSLSSERQALLEIWGPDVLGSAETSMLSGRKKQ